MVAYFYFARYIEAVIDGSEVADNSVGRTLWDLVQSVPKVSNSLILLIAFIADLYFIPIQYR